MKKWIALLCAVVLLGLAGTAIAADYQYSYGERLKAIDAQLKDKLALRTGPGTNYTELGTYSERTPIVIYEQEIGGSVSWVMVEFRADGGLVRAYTGMKRVYCDGSVPWANTQTYEARLSRDVTPLRGPGGQYASMRNTLPKGTRLTVFNVEDGYIMADFQYPGENALTRAWIPEDALSTY